MIIDDNHGRRYKALRLEGGSNWIEIPECQIDRWTITDPPEDETRYKVGQVFLKRCGSKCPAVVVNVEPGVGPEFNLYTLFRITMKGEYDQKEQIYEKDIDKNYKVKQDLQYMLEFGSPTSIIKRFFEERKQALEEEVQWCEDMVRQVHHL